MKTSLVRVLAGLGALAALSPRVHAFQFERRHTTGPAYQAIPVEPQFRADFLSGRVVDEAGKAIQGASVDAFHWYPGNETKTDASGAFRLSNSNPERPLFEADEKIEITFSAPGYTPRYIAVQPLGKMTRPVVLSRATFIQGTVRDGAGKPVANAKVRAVAGPFYGDGVQITEVPYTTTSDAQGRYKLFLQSDTYELFVLGTKGVSRTAGIVLSPGKSLVKNIALQPGATFRARVVDSLTKKPVKGVKLVSRSDFDAQSDANGIIQIPNMFSGLFGWSVEAPGIARWWSEEASNQYERKSKDDGHKFQRNFDELHFQIASKMAPVTIVVELGVKISGRVLDPDGKPVAGATVAPALTGTGNSLTGDTRFSVRTNAKGQYNGLFPAGHEREWNLIAHDGDYDQWRKWANVSMSPFKTQAGQEVKNFDLKLQRPVVVTGFVVNKAGLPVAHAEVRAVQADKLANRYYDPTVETDAKGRFQLRFVSPGKHFVQVAPFWLSAEEAPDGSSKTIEVKEGKPVDVGTLTQVETR